MQKLIVSMIRLSTAMSLYGLEQLQQAVSLSTGGQDMFRLADRFETTLDSMTEALSGGMDERKRDTLESITRMAEDVLHASVDTMNALDPREILNATAGVVGGWMRGAESSDGDEPKPVADVLG